MSKRSVVVFVILPVVLALLLALLVFRPGNINALPATKCLFEKWCFPVLWTLFAVFLALRVAERFKQKYWATWFRPGHWVWKNEHEWCEIKSIMLRDPLDSFFHFRGGKPESVLGDVIGLLAGIIIPVAITVGLLWHLPLPASANNGLSNDKLLAAVGAVLALAGVLYTIRAKVRSENRQKWIDEVRENLAIVINYAGYRNAFDNSPGDYKLFSLTSLRGKPFGPRFDSSKPPYMYPEINLARLTLELLINPSEKDHRTLSTLLRLLCGIETLEIDNIVMEKLGISAGDKEDHRKLITWTIRLSNAMLKREWELIKYGK